MIDKIKGNLFYESYMAFTQLVLSFSKNKESRASLQFLH